MLDKLKEGLQGAINKILRASSIDEQTVKEFVKDLQRALLQADVNVKQVLELSKKIEERALKEQPPPGLPRKDYIVKILYDELANILGSEQPVDLPSSRINIVLMMGIQGSGKTTTVGKLARHMQRRGYRVGVVCVDTFRPGALTQLKMVCSQIGLEVYGSDDVKDAVQLAKKGSEYFKQKGCNLIIVDSAGRHKEEKGLLDEMKQISSTINPDLTLLVVDGTIGQQCYNQAAAFHQTVPIGGIVITKLDGSAKGGGALAAAAATGATILFIGTGERIDDLEAFSPTRFVGRLLGLGDIKALLERAKDLEQEADEKKVKRIMSGKMTIDDLYYQMEQVKKMGSLRKIVELIPGFSTGIPESELDGIEDRMKNWKVIIQSMTKKEKEDPEILNASRVKRIARGSGTSDSDVKDMLKRYRQAKTVMKAAKGREIRQLMRRLSV
ncbi:MAG: signal recognition particle protein [Thaumarchaeota archaeon]|nr:signal recognition particle protein [Nitrososphaerota archaeon]